MDPRVNVQELVPAVEEPSVVQNYIRIFRAGLKKAIGY